MSVASAGWDGNFFLKSINNNTNIKVLSIRLDILYSINI
jgi:hypothetical protein